jgi:hypothetical protein
VQPRDLPVVVVPRTSAQTIAAGARRWLERHARTIAAVLLVAVAVAPLRNGIAGPSDR